MSQYPIPDYAATLWLAGDEINIAFPSPLDAGSHVVRFPASERGLTLLLRILREREKVESVQDLTIGNKAAPTQYMTEARYREIVKAIERDKAAKEAADAELDSIFDDIGLPEPKGA